MKPKTFIASLFLCFNLLSFGQHKIIPLWKSGKIPNQLKTTEKEQITFDNIKHISNVQEPTIEVFLAPKTNNSTISVIICPGGGYGNIAYDYEGTDFAKWLNSKGINAFVLKYRLPNSPSLKTPYLAPLQDIQRAIRLIKSLSKKFNITPQRVGVLGFSAGGHLAASLGTHYEYSTNRKKDKIDAISAKPHFMALIYPVISMQDSITHLGSKRNLLGITKANEALVSFFSNELQVKPTTPQTFLVHASNDKAVSVENSLLFYKALTKHNIAVEMHIYPFGGHGFAFAKDQNQLANWPELFFNWLINIE